MTTSDLSSLNGQLDEYRLDQLLDEGTSTPIYRAFDVKLQRTVKLRVLAPPFATTSEHTERFLREAQTLAQLAHPNIVRIYRAGQFEGIYYLAMQDVEGADVAWLVDDYRQTNEVMPLDDILQLACDVGSALDYMHDQGVAHRDIRPKNIIVDPSGQARLTHFGLAAFDTEHGAAPDDAAAQADLVAFGLVLFEVLTGEAPFPAVLSGDSEQQDSPGAVPRPSEVNSNLTEAFDEVVLRCLDPDPGRRYATGAEMCEALRRAAASERTKPAPLDARRHSLLHIPEKVTTHLHAAPAQLAPPQGAVAAASPIEPMVDPGKRTLWQSTHASLLWLIASFITCLTLVLGTIAIIILLVVSPNEPSSASVAATEVTVSPDATAAQSTPTVSPETTAVRATPAVLQEATAAQAAIASPPDEIVTDAAAIPSATSLPSPSPVQTVIVVAPTSQPPTLSPAPSGPPEDRFTVPANSTRLGEFAVEQYCNRQGYGVALTNSQTDWACTNRRTRSIEFILAPADFDAICRERYSLPDAFAIRDQTKPVQAYNWSCFVYAVPIPTATITPITANTPSGASLIPMRAPDWLALVNMSSAPVLLDSVEFRRGDRTLRSADWGVTVLLPGECLRITRGAAPAVLPDRCNRALDYAGSEEARSFWLDGDEALYLDVGPDIRFVVH